jgi:hypothetical protein
MKSIIRTAALAMATAFVLAVCGCATTAEQRAGCPPRIETQFEIRGLDAFLDSIDRLPLPNLSPRQLRTMFEQLGLGIAGISPFKITDTKGTAPIRIIVWKLPVFRGASGLIFDIPAAGGNPSGVIGKIAATGVFKPRKLDSKDAAILPAGARRFHSPALKRNLLVVPHGNRVALMDISDISPASALRLLEEAPPVLAEGTLAIAPYPGTLMDTMAGWTFAVTSVEECSVGFGIDDANRLRTSISLRPRPGKPLARLVSTVSAPSSPLAGTLLFPSTLAALSVRYSLDGLSDEELLPVYTARTDFSGYVRGFAGQHGKPGNKQREALARTQLALQRLVGCETTAAVFPGNAAVPLPWAVLFTDLPSPDVLDALPSCLASFLSARLDLLKAMAPSPDIAALVGKLDLGIEFAGERTVRGIPVRTYALRASNPDNPGQRSDILTFDAATVGGALLLGHLPGAALDNVLSTLAAGKTSRGPLSALPAFSQIAGGVPRDAATGFIRGRPVLKNLLPAARNLVQTIAEEWSLDTSGFPSDDEFDASLSELPDFTLTYSCCWLPGENRMSSTITLPMDDVKAVADFFCKSGKAQPTPSHGRR